MRELFVVHVHKTCVSVDGQHGSVRSSPYHCPLPPPPPTPGIIGTVVLLVLILILIFLGKKIRISIAIIQEASK